MRIKHGNSSNSILSSNADATVARKRTSAKNKQLQEAVVWCQANEKRGYAALKTGLLLLFKDRETINTRLDGNVVTGEERVCCTILTPEKENCIVEFVKSKNRCMQALEKSELEKLSLDVLRIRNHTNEHTKVTESL